MNPLEKLAEILITGKPTPEGLWDKINGLDPVKYKEAYNRVKERLEKENPELIKY